MKKLLLIALSAFALNAQAQQLPNASFEEDWVTCYPYTYQSNSSSSPATVTCGTTPTSWTVSNVLGYYFSLTKSWLGGTEVGSQIEGQTGNGVKLESKTTMNNNIPGYMTLGTSWNTASTTGGNRDGGSFGGIDFTYKPDAMRFYYQRTTEGEDATIVAYLWKGTVTQANVPVSIASSPKKVTMTDRDRNVLGEKGTYGDDPVYSDDFARIATLEKTITDTPSEWTQITIPFTYENTTDTPEKINVIFACNEYYNSTVGSLSTLSIDEVELLYYSELASVSYDGTDYEVASSMTINEEYEESKLTLTSNGAGASIEKSYNETTKVLTITVKGNDIETNTTNYNTYTIQFGKTYGSVLTGISYNSTTYAVSSSMTIGEEYDASLLALTTSDDATYSLDYNSETCLLTITVNGGDIESNTTNYHTYTIQFDVVAKESTEFTGTMLLSVMGSAQKMDADKIYVVKTTNSTKNTETYSFELYDFNYDGIEIGDIVVDVTRTESDGKAIYQGTGSLNIAITGDDVAPEVYAEQVGTDVMGAHIVIPDIASLGNLTMEVYFSPLVEITPDKTMPTFQTSVAAVSLTRDFYKGWNTICLPFDFTMGALYTEEVTPSFQEFSSASASSLTFASVGTNSYGYQAMTANTPYLVYFESDVLNTTFYMGASVTSTTPVEVTNGNFTFVGNYDPTVTMENKYGVADFDGVQKLAKGSSSYTLDATKAYFTSTTDASDVRVMTDGMTDGIDAVVSTLAESGKVYNMQGQQVSSKNLKKGLYIVNGKKQIVK